MGRSRTTSVVPRAGSSGVGARSEPGGQFGVHVGRLTHRGMGETVPETENRPVLLRMAVPTRSRFRHRLASDAAVLALIVTQWARADPRTR